MCIETDNVFLRLERENGTETALQLALVVAANKTIGDALDMLSGKRAGLEEQRKRLIVLFSSHNTGSNLRGQAAAYIKHQP